MSSKTTRAQSPRTTHVLYMRCLPRPHMCIVIQDITYTVFLDVACAAFKDNACAVCQDNACLSSEMACVSCIAVSDETSLLPERGRSALRDYSFLRFLSFWRECKVTSIPGGRHPPFKNLPGRGWRSLSSPLKSPFHRIPF